MQVWGKAACRLEPGVKKKSQTNNFFSVFPVLRESAFEQGRGRGEVGERSGEEGEEGRKGERAKQECFKAPFKGN